MLKMAIIYHSESGHTKEMAELVAEGAQQVQGCEARCMSVDEVDEDFVRASAAVALGSPAYNGSCSWQIKRFLDEQSNLLSGRLGGVFCSQNWPQGGGASFVQMTMIAGMLTQGMMVYSGGVSAGQPYLHFGAVSAKAPDEDLYRSRCIKLGHNLASKAKEMGGGIR
jgi:NAD(P)H dehydrogenase (quinone)